MKVSALIEQYNMERPNEVEDSAKVSMLKKIEHIIINEVILTHEFNKDDAPMEMSVTGSTLHINKGGNLTQHLDSFGMHIELLIPEPYEDVYTFFLDMRIAFNNNDMKRYNVASAMYNNALLTYQQYYNRTHKANRAEVPYLQHDKL